MHELKAMALGDGGWGVGKQNCSLFIFKDGKKARKEKEKEKCVDEERRLAS